MAARKGTGENRKVTFGKRRLGKYKKSYGPKSQKPKKYVGQGR